jgi:hypothetical protein
MRRDAHLNQHPDNPGISEKYLGNFSVHGKKTCVARAKLPRTAKFPRCAADIKGGMCRKPDMATVPGRDADA